MKTPKAKAQKAKPRSRVRKSIVQTEEAINVLKKRDPKYSLAITMSGQVFETKADDLFDAMMEFRPEKITGKLVLTVEANGNRFVRYVLPMQARRIYVNAMTMRMFIKGIENVLK